MAEGVKKGPILPSETLASAVMEDKKEELVVFEMVRVSSFLLLGFELRIVGLGNSRVNSRWI